MNDKPGHPFNDPDSKVHGANLAPIWGRQDPGGPYVGHMNLAILGVFQVWRFMFSKMIQES